MHTILEFLWHEAVIEIAKISLRQLWKVITAIRELWVGMVQVFKLLLSPESVARAISGIYKGLLLVSVIALGCVLYSTRRSLSVAVK